VIAVRQLEHPHDAGHADRQATVADAPKPAGSAAIAEEEIGTGRRRRRLAAGIDKETWLVLSTDSEFFRYLKSTSEK
jgi:hypothetical protein